MARILVVDDEKSIRLVLKKYLQSKGHEVLEAKNGVEAVEIAKENPLDLVFLDLKMPEKGGFETLEELKSIPTVILTAYGNIDYTVKAIDLGASDYITKPFSFEEIDRVIEKLIPSHEGKSDFPEETTGIVGRSKRMQEIFKTIAKVAKSSITVLITGESGTGKEVIARAIHNYSNRKNKPFVAVNCAALPENLLEAELFGYEKGAFTGAVSSKRGLFEQADGGTLFLDEIGELPLHLQSKLLRVLQEKEIRPIGSSKSKRVDVRIVAATNRNLEEEVKKGNFREDLFFRLNIVRIEIPPLRERREDIIPLAYFFINKFSKEFKLEPKELSSDAVDFLLSYDFPGNVRELENMVLRAMVLSSSPVLTPQDFNLRRGERVNLESIISDFVGKVFSIEQKEENNLYEIVIKSTERVLIREVLKRCNFNQVKASKILGIHRNTLRRKIRELKIEL
ncbi:two component, sigma54 specific, transcriptional regulator, Fis family [Balnearium lithotrophicum]|uniref:DNA-binding transcriptional regulator NtrC n=1 Tax=Balnearium lithotrophicum TaxID=223788 RepID=A0A521BRT6_9BACT|nr:sigma-54 dependent transcriptional regulator [Balnearium lithotrophicum]SMO49833.1 two component, sigma54 specific, transcriptional regulator, Fis family [Balnearium lithotrophicum]